jgi:alkyldihydroxyacetonephosphate synthase
MWPLALLWIRQGRIPKPPDVVVWPKDEAEIAALVKTAREQKLPLIPFGAGSGVCGGTWAVRGGISVDLKKLDTISEVDPVRRTVDVGAGVMGEVLERELNARGWTLGHFPSSIYMSTVGGWLAARSAGQLSCRYGKIEDMVVSCRAVLGTGEIVQTKERPFRGPDLAQVLIGSEGTLCTFTQARLRVYPKAETQVFHAYEFQGVQIGVDAIRRIFRAGLRPAVVRLYDPFDTALVGDSKGAGERAREPLHTDLKTELTQQLGRMLAPLTVGKPAVLNALAHRFRRVLLILMFEGETGRCQSEDLAAREICAGLNGVDRGEEPARAWYRKRYEVSYRMSKLIDANTFVDTLECAAPWSKVLQVYERVHEAAGKLAFVLCHFSHAYVDGCSLYFSFVGSGKDEPEIESRYRAMWRSALSAAVSAGANVSHHHGIGLLKAQTLQDGLGDGRAVLAALKATYDPDGIMNPGKLGL